MSADHFFATLLHRYGRRRVARLRHQMGILYRDVDFSGKAVLDIGGGIGLHSLYAACRGATAATIIEPEGEGGHREMIATFNRLQAEVKCRNVNLVRSTFQAFEADAARYDIVLVHDAINHFDESACITLRESPASWEVYDDIFARIAALIRPGGTLLVSDCSPRNIFAGLGVPNPFDLNIEWHKHQPPHVWIGLAGRHGLVCSDLRWSTPARLGSLGQVVVGNAIGAWLFTSHFVLQFRRCAPHDL
jgi:SAM-dependent methyltransferase